MKSKNVSIGSLGRIQASCFSPSPARHISLDQGYLQFKLFLVKFSRTMHKVGLERGDAGHVSNVGLLQ